MSIKHQRMLRGIAVMWLVVMSSISIFAQTSQVAGIVLDPQSNALVGAKITITNKDKNLSREAITNAEGKYQFPLITPGNYSVRAEAKGFSTLVEEDVRVLINSPLTLNLTFTKLGEVSETVTIQSEGNLLNTTDATIGNNFTAPQISNLPLDGRNVVALLSLQPGVTRMGYVNGSRSDQANVVLDGVDVNEQQTGLNPISEDNEAFSSVLRTTPDSVQEFRVTTTNPNANQGRSSGGQVELVTKSGTNQFHGSLYEFNRNDSTASNTFFNNRAGVAKPKLNRNVFGGTVGGPIKNDRIFFFYNYEGRREVEGKTTTREVPLASLGQGQLKFNEYDPGTGVTTLRTLQLSELNALFPEAQMNPIAIKALADAASKYPANDLDTVGDGLNVGGYRFNANVPLSWNTHIAKLDFNINDKHNLFIRGNYQIDNIGSAPQFPDTPYDNNWHHPYGYSAGHIWLISPNMVNKINFGLTRLALSNAGDSSENSISFRDVFQPYRFTRTFHRKTPVYNITDDLSWNKGNHSFQFGANLRFVRNIRKTASTSYDRALTSASVYEYSGDVLTDPIYTLYPKLTGALDIQSAMAALIGRFSQYDVDYNYKKDGALLPLGAEVDRTFATEQYDFYAQDSWKIGRNLTLNVGLRYGIGSPVYEANGLQVAPTTPLGEYFEKRKKAALEGKAYNELISVDLAGPANNRPGYYPWDLNNFQPRISVAWSPNFNNGLLKKILGESGKSVFRGGFAMTHDHIGQQLAVTFNNVSTLGYSMSQLTSANQFNVTDKLAPLFTKYGQKVREFPGIVIPNNVAFPLQTPADNGQRIESSLDSNLVSPVNYSWNFSYSRELPKGITVEASYIGRMARNLLAQRDVMAFNNLTDPKSGMDWYTAATRLAKLRETNTPIASVQSIPYFENLFPSLSDDTTSSTQAVYSLMAKRALGGNGIRDWTYIQAILNDVEFPNAFVHPQFAALSTFSTIARSDYHAGTLTVKQRLKNQLYFDFNYTFSKSIDNASGLQNSGQFGTSFILNSLRPEDNRAVSDFDIAHIVNANTVWDMPFGRGKQFFSSMPKPLDVLLGGWQLSSIFRWNSGLPVIGCCSEQSVWATNWQIGSNGVLVKPLKANPSKKNLNLFSDPKEAYKSFRNAYPGETGNRNFLRLPGYIVLDMGLAKTFKLPWYESHEIQFRWDTFNATNTQRLDEIETLGLGNAPNLGLSAPSATFGKFNSTQGDRRTMQFSLRYKF